MSDSSDEDLRLAGTAVDAYAPVGLVGAAIGGLLAALVLLTRLLQRRRHADRT